MAFRSNVNISTERGGTTVLVKNYLAKNVACVQTDLSDQVWVRFRYIFKCLFGFYYLPPSDSEYYSCSGLEVNTSEEVQFTVRVLQQDNIQEAVWSYWLLGE